MFDFKALNSAKGNASANQGKQIEKYDEIYDEAFKLFLEFNETEDMLTLKQAAEKFSQLVKLKHNRVEPYFFLAWSFYLIGENELAVQYLETAQGFDPDFVEVNGLLEIIKSEGRV